MRTSRRDFFSMLGIASGAFIAPKGMYAALAPNRKLRMGVVSDVHISFSSPELWKWKKALEHFRDVKVDVVAVAGDLANEGLITELEAFAKAWYEIFPDNKRPDGARVEHVFSMGNHDVGVWAGIKKRYIKKGEDGKEILDEEALKKILICHNRERVWKELFHDEYSHFYAKNVKGYWFLASHWRSAGQKHEYEALELPAYLKDHADELGKTKPFFFVQHPHPRGTCHGQDAWWPDSGKNTTEVLKDFPNAVCFSGHSHSPLTDAKAIWQGGFTSLGTGSLSYCSPLGNDPTPDIKCHAVTPEGHPYKMDCHDGYVIDVHEGFLAVRRMEFKSMKPLGDEWIVPVPVKPDPEFAFEPRKAARKPPAYKETPKVEIKTVRVKRWNGELEEKQQLSFSAVPQGGKAHSRVYGYEVTLRPKDGSPTVIKNIRSAAADMPIEMEPDCVLCHFTPGTFKAVDDYEFDIVPFDSFRTRADRTRRRKCVALIGGPASEEVKGLGVDVDVFFKEGAKLDGLLAEVLGTFKRHDAYVFVVTPDDKDTAKANDIKRSVSRLVRQQKDVRHLVSADVAEQVKFLRQI